MTATTVLDTFLEIVEVRANGAENGVELWTGPDVRIKIDGLSIRCTQHFSRLLYRKVRVVIEEVEA